MSDRGAVFHQPGPRDWLRQTAGAAAPSGGRELHAVSDRGGSTYNKPMVRLEVASFDPCDRLYQWMVALSGGSILPPSKGVNFVAAKWL